MCLWGKHGFECNLRKGKKDKVSNKNKKDKTKKKQKKDKKGKKKKTKSFQASDSDDEDNDNIPSPFDCILQWWLGVVTGINAFANSWFE